MKHGTKVLVILLALFTVSFAALAQLSGPKSIPGTYPSLAAAITDLNTVGVGAGGVTFNVAAGHSETAPATGYVITATGTLANPIVFQKSGVGTVTFTASAGLTAGAINDGIITIVGGDYITVDGFTLLENPANTDSVIVSNNMTEFGVALFYTTTSDGPQNNTIKNCTITLKRNYPNTFGIYSNVRHTAGAVTLAADIAAPSGAQNDLKIYGNNISNVNLGIVVIGSTTGANMTTGLDIGGAGAPTGNTVSNYGTTGTFSAYVSVAASVNGILVNNQQNFNISYNSVTSSVGGVTVSGTIRGIYVQTTGTLPAAGAFTRAITNNSISVQGGAAANVLQGIATEGGNLTISQTINSNDFHDFGHTVSGTGAITFIVATNAVQNSTINNNTFTNMTVNTTGSVTFINKNITHPASAVLAVNNNAIVTQFTKTGAGGTVFFYDSFGTTPSTAVENNNGNNFSNVTLTGATAVTALWRSGDGPAGTPFGPKKTVTNNTFSNIVLGTSAAIVLTVSYSRTADTNNVSGNLISNVTAGGAVTAINSVTSSQNFFSNTINRISSTGGAAVNGFSIGGGVAQNIYKNKIYDLTANNATGTVNGMLITSVPATINVYNNLIDSLNAPITSDTNGVRGISITGTSTSTTLNVSYNTISLNATSSGTDFGSSGIFATSSATATTAALHLRNNIIVNTSVPNGLGVTVAYRRSNATLTNYGSTSDNNLFYAGPADASHLIFRDGTNSDQLLATYKPRVSPRDAASVTENPPFLSISGASPNFLHINTSIATQIEGGAASIAGITDDYDGNTRCPGGGCPGAGATPDIGADEFNGTSGADLVPPGISYTPLGNTGVVATRNLATTILDGNSGVQHSVAGSPRVYYKKGVGGVYSSTTGTEAPAGTYTFTITHATVGAGLNDTVYYYVAAQDSAGNAGTNPGGTSPTINPPNATVASPNSYRIVPIPVVGVTPDSLSASLAAGDSTTQNLVIRNTGNGPLTWSISEVPAIPAERPAGEQLKYNLPEPALPKGIQGAPGLARLNGGGGPDAFGYRWIDSDSAGGPVFTWVDISGSGTLLDTNLFVPTGTFPKADEGYFPMQLPFTFNYYGVAKDSLFIGTNGNVMFQRPTGNIFTNAAFPTAGGAIDNHIGVFWDDLKLSTAPSAKIFYGMSGADFVVQFDSIGAFSTPTVPDYTFEIILSPNGTMKSQYRRMAGALTGAAIGIENATGTIGLGVVNNAAYVHNSLAILFYNGVTWLSTSPSSGSVNPGDSAVVAVKFNSTGLPAGVYEADLQVGSNDPVTPTETIGAKLTVTSSSITTAIAAGWNLISNPVTAPNDSVKKLFPAATFPYGFKFAGASGYQQDYTMENGVGFWEKFASAGVNDFTGLGTARNSDSLVVVAGWNIVGSVTGSVDTTTITTDSGIPLAASHWFKYLSGYPISGTIDQGKGYWKKATRAGKFYLTGVEPSARPASRPVQLVVNSMDALNTVTITDSKGGSQTLYFGSDAKIDGASYEMPPAPPAGAFDARFSAADGGYMIRTHPAVIENIIDLPVAVQSVAYPLTVSWKIASGSYTLSDAVGGQAFSPKSMTGEGSVQISHDKFTIKVLGGAGVPTEFALSQNYPNPFNPTTNISFALPVQSKVTIDIYNVLGQKIRTLLKEDRQAGYHVAEWNGTGNAGQQLGSGVYFLQLSATGANGKSFNEVRKLMMLK